LLEGTPHVSFYYDFYLISSHTIAYTARPNSSRLNFEHFDHPRLTHSSLATSLGVTWVETFQKWSDWKGLV